MKADIEKLEELSLADMITIYRYFKDRWMALNYKVSDNKLLTADERNELIKSELIGRPLEKMIADKMNDFIKIETT